MLQLIRVMGLSKDESVGMQVDAETKTSKGSDLGRMIKFLLVLLAVIMFIGWTLSLWYQETPDLYLHLKPPRDIPTSKMNYDLRLALTGLVPEAELQQLINQSQTLNITHKS
jgi:hypothetical protein